MYYSRITKSSRIENSFLNMYTVQALTELTQLKFLKNFHSCENAGINNTGDGKSASNNSTNCGQKVINWRTGFMILDSDWIQIITEPNGRNNSAPMSKRDVTSVGVSVLICN